MSYDETGQVWAMLHSGSRNLGNETAVYHDKIAEEVLRRSGQYKTAGLNYMEIKSKEGQAYLNDMKFCQVML